MAYLQDWIRETAELSPTTKLFLHCLASYADADTGVCYPSQPTIARAMSMSVATVQRELQKCLELKLLDVRRRWRKSNVYRLLCLKETVPKKELSTMTSSDEARKQPPFVQNNVGNAPVDNSPKKTKWVSPREISVLLEDIGEIMGNRLLEQNKNFYVRIIRSATATYELIQECLARVRQSILEAQCTGDSIHNPSGLFWWMLKQAGVRI